MKKFIVTGAGQGIGFEIVQQLLTEDHFVILNDSDNLVLVQADTTLRQKGFLNYKIILADSSSDEFLNELESTILKTPGVLAGCVCNAGITTFGDFWDYQKTSMHRLLDVNIMGTFFLIQKIALLLKNNKLPGSIVVTTSVTGHQAHPDLAAYGMTKAALSQLVKNLVIDLSPVGIRINAVSPGATLTERTSQDLNYQQEWARITPMGLPADVQDISNAICFFLSEKSKHITGQTLIVDGGWTSISPAPN